MQKLIVGAVFLILVSIVLLNSSMVADPVLSWVAANPKDPSAPDALYDTARCCDFLGNNDKAGAIYLQLYQQYPKRADLCAPGLYHLAYNLANGSYIVGLKRQALPYLQIIMDQYPTEGDWGTKAKQLTDEVNGAH
jgi:tetratricopeptide (TPR) repeat protein